MITEINEILREINLGIKKQKQNNKTNSILLKTARRDNHDRSRSRN